MLHDPNHEESAPDADAITLTSEDRDMLRRLAADVAEIATLPVQKEKAALWTRLNDLEADRPMIWINQICWNEMNVDDELTLRCEHPWARDQERDLRRLLYQWRHLPGDMVVNDFLTCPLAVHSTSFGIIEDVNIVKTDESSDVVSRHYNVQIRDWDDLDKIRMPVVTHDKRATACRYETMCGVYDGILPIKKRGQAHIWFTPWDFLIRWWGIEEAMIDLIERPDFVHAAVDRMVDAWMTELDQFEEIKNRYVISRKPSPAVLATDTWHPELARRDIREFLDLTDGQCHVELIMKDISTVRYQPQRLWEWAAIAMEEVQ